MAYHSIDISSASIFISKNLPIWDGQRTLNLVWIDTLKKEQISHISQYGIPCFPGSFVLIKFNGMLYIADGQHREQVIRDLLLDGHDVNVKIVIETYDCDINRELARSIYLFSNNRYKYNSGVEILNQNKNVDLPKVIPTIPAPQQTSTAKLHDITPLIPVIH